MLNQKKKWNEKILDLKILNHLYIPSRLIPNFRNINLIASHNSSFQLPSRIKCITLCVYSSHNPSSFPMQTIQLNRPLTTDRLISECTVIYIYGFNSGGVMIYILHRPPVYKWTRSIVVKSLKNKKATHIFVLVMVKYTELLIPSLI